MPYCNFEKMNSTSHFVGREPSWIVNSGIGLIFFILASLLSLSWFIHYPDTILAKVILTTKQPPVKIVSKAAARIEKIYVENGQTVKEGAPLMLLNSDVNYIYLLKLEKIIDSSYLSPIKMREKILSLTLLKGNSLGSLQTSLNKLTSVLNEIYALARSEVSVTKNSRNERLQDRYEELEERLQTKKNTWMSNLSVEEKRLERNAKLFSNNIISASELEPIQSRFLEMKNVLNDIDIQLELNRIQLDKARMDIKEYLVNKKWNERSLKAKLHQQILAFKSEIGAWKRTYLFSAPTMGEISFTRFWSANQSVNIGDTVLFLSDNLSEVIGKLHVPHHGAGKIRVGQQVSIELERFPHLEYGELNGEVTYISSIPDESGYHIDVKLPDGLLTNYRKQLNFTPNMIGTAKIVTQDKKLIERLFNKISFSFNK